MLKVLHFHVMHHDAADGKVVMHSSLLKMSPQHKGLRCTVSRYNSQMIFLSNKLEYFWIINY